MIFYSVRRMTRDDVAAAAAVERACFTEPWSEDAFSATLLLPYASYYVAELDDGSIVGICGLRNIVGVGEITNVGVLPQYRGNHIAGRMLRQLMREGREDGVKDFTLEVRAGNDAALQLYKGLGFEVEGRRPRFYTHPTEDALIMWSRDPSR